MVEWFNESKFEAQGPLRAVAFRCLGVLGPAGSAAIGLEGTLFWAKKENKEPMALMTRGLDRFLSCVDENAASFGSAILAYEAWLDLPMSMKKAPFRLVVSNVHVAHVLTNLDRRSRSENVPSSCVDLRAELLELVKTSEKRPWVQLILMGSRRSVRWLSAFGALEKRLLYKMGVGRRPKIHSLPLAEVGNRLRAVGWDSTKSPPMLGLVVDLMLEKGLDYGELVDLFGLSRRRLYDARNRWKSKFDQI
jgi:hypothetical protein